MGCPWDTVPSGISTCSGTGPPWAAWHYLLCHGAPSPPLTLVFPLLFLTLFPLLLFLSLNVFSEVLPASLMGPAVSCDYRIIE